MPTADQADDGEDHIDDGKNPCRFIKIRIEDCHQNADTEDDGKCSGNDITGLLIFIDD